MTTDTRTCLTCGRPHGVDGWNPRHPARYYEPTRPVVNMGPAPDSGNENEYKFTSNRQPDALERDLQQRGFEPTHLSHVYVSPQERLGRRTGSFGNVSYQRTVKDAPPASTDIPPGTPLIRREQNLPLAGYQFANAAARALAGELPFLNKRRYDVPLDDGSGLVAEVDFYSWPPDIPAIIEVEVKDGETRYITPADLPEGFREGVHEVTQDPAYYAANIATRLPA